MFMAAVIVTLTAGSGQSGGLHVSSTQALFAAESGIERALYGFSRQGTACANLTLNGTLTIGSATATYATTGTPYNPANPTTLSAAITAGATTIATNAADLAATGYAPRGRIRIDTEEIIYTGLSGGSFTGAQRGAAGTTAAGHLINASVYQNQCTIQSVGSAPGSAQRTLEKAVVGRSFKYGSFQKSILAAPRPQAITGVGFRPKAVIFYWTKQAAAGFTNTGGTGGINMGIGFATGAANERVVSVTAVDNSANSDDGRRRSDTNMITILNGGGAPTGVAAQAELTSLDADGFTINWTTNDANAYRIHYLALGGDVTNAVAGSFNLTTTAVPPTQSVAGLGFQPDFVMFLWSFTEAVNTSTATANIGVGLARSATARGAIAYAARDNVGSNNAKRWQQRTDSTIFVLNAANPPATDAIADLVTMDAGGFTINKSDRPAASTPIFYLALKGGQHQVGAFTQPAATGNQTTATVGFEPQGLALLSWNRVASVSTNPVGGVGPEVSAAVSFGAASATTERGSTWFQDRNVDRSDANMYTATTDAITLATGPSTANARADFYSFDTGGFTLNWTSADATARQLLYWAIGPTVSNTNMGWREVYP